MKHQTLSTEEIVNIPEEPFYHWDMEQRTDEWYKARMGKITGSSVHKLFGTKQAKEKYLADKASEIITGFKSDSDENQINFHMQRGIEYEARAKEHYSLKTLSAVEECGLIQLGQYLACSPDGLIGEDGMIEIKIPDSGKYLTQVVELTNHGINKIPYEHQLQMQFNMHVGDRNWCDYVLYNPKHEVTEKHLFIIRFYRNREMRAKIADALESSILYIQNLVNEYNDLLLS